MRACPPNAAGQIFSLLMIACIALSFIATTILSADSRTIVISGGVSSHSHVKIVDTFTITGISPPLSNGSRVTYNAPIYDSENINGFSQTISGIAITATVPDNVALTAQQDLTDVFNNKYRHYEWSLNGYSASTMTITVTTEFDCTATGSPTPDAFTEAFPVSAPGMSQYLAATPMVQSSDSSIVNRAQQITSGATTEADAVNRIMDYLKENVADQFSSSDSRDALWTYNNGRGNCVNRANFALALLRASGIPARFVGGVVSDDAYSVNFVAQEGSGRFDNHWGKEMHAWVEVYYPQHGWVPYDPLLNKGFIDQRHVKYGTSLESLNPATVDESLGGSSTVMRVYNAGTGRDRSTSISFTQVQDTGSYTFRALKDAPGGSGVYVLGRDMVNAPTPVPTATPIPTATPTATALPNVTATPVPNATASITPRPMPNATAAPTTMPQPTQTINNDVNVTQNDGLYYVSGVVADARTGARLRNATVTFDGKQVTVDATGSFIFRAPNGTYTLVVSVPGYATGSMPVTVSGSDVSRVIQVSEPVTGGETKSGWPIPVPGFSFAAALAGLLLIALYRYGRA